MIQWMLAIWSLVPVPFLKPAWTSGSSQVTYCRSLAWRILSITLLACEMSAIEVSQEAGQVVWYFHLLKKVPQVIVIHTVKCFGMVNKAEVDVFLVFSCLFDDLMDVGNLTSGSSAFSKSNLNIWNSWFMYCWSLAWRILSITLLACEMSAIVRGSLSILWHCLSFGL